MAGANQIATRILLEVFADMRAGVVPHQVRDFSALHNYVDANAYGGFAPRDEAEVALLNRAQEIADQWLKANPPRPMVTGHKPGTCEPRCHICSRFTWPNRQKETGR